MPGMMGSVRAMFWNAESLRTARACGAQDGKDSVGVGGGVDGEIERGNGKVAGVVGDGGNLRVGNEIESAIAVAQGCQAQTEIFDGAGKRVELDGVAYIVLVLQQYEDSVEDVLKEGLRTEADAHSDNAGGGEQGSGSDAKDVEDMDEQDEADNTVTGGADDAGDCADLRGAREIAGLAICQLAHTIDEEGDDACEHKGDDNDHEQARQIAVDEGEKIVTPLVQHIGEAVVPFG